MLTVFIISFVVLCLSLLLVLMTSDDKVTWQIIVWRNLLVLSSIGTIISLYILMSEYGFGGISFIGPLIGLAFAIFFGGVITRLTLELIAWVFGKNVYDFITFLTGTKCE